MKQPIAIATLMFLLANTVAVGDAAAQGWLDKLKSKAKDAVEDTVNDETQDATNQAKEAVTPQKAPAKTTSSSSSSSTQSKAASSSGTTYGQTVGAASNLIQKWPYDGVKGDPVRNIELKGVKLGMPLPDAEAALDKEGFSRVTGLRYQRMYYELNGKRHALSAAEYYNLPAEQQGKILRTYVVELTTITPSPAIMKELPAYPKEKKKEVKLTADQARRCKLYESRNRMWAQGLSGAEVRELKDKCSNAAGDAPGYSAEPQYVSRIWYGQKFLSGEKVNYDAFKEKAFETFGNPTYAYNGTIHMAGAAFNRKGLSWYVDSALVPKADVYELLSKSDDGQRSMIFKDFIHPGNASNGYYVKAYENSFEDMEKALRVGYAPHMAIGYERGAFVVDLEWPFLSMEKSYRKLWNDKKAQEAQPEADVAF